MNNKQRGFTLIELLVVIGIIGILAALVLVALGSARTRANDARVKSNLGQMRVLAEVYYDNNDSSYTGFDTCVATPTAANCESQDTSDAIASLNADTASATTAGFTATATATEFCVSAPLNANGNHATVTETGEFSEETAACS